MKKIACLSLLLAVLLLVSGPALAGGTQTVSDIFDPNTGVGQFLIWIGDDIYLLITYTDYDNSRTYTPGDGIVRVQRLVAIPT